MSEVSQIQPFDFSQLYEFLAEKQWKLADDETRSLMCRVAGREAIPHLNPEVIGTFPCEVLRKIDFLWSTSSLGRFGFQVQRQLWLESGGIGCIYDFHQMSRSEREALGKIEHIFSAKVGWRNSSGWSGPSETCATGMLTGHFPFSCLICSYGRGLIGLVASAMAWRIQDCSIPAA